MKPLVLFTAKEMGDAILPIMINARFNSFFATFCAHEGLQYDTVIEDARNILRAAEIPQPGDELLVHTPGSEPIDLTPFLNEED